MAAIPTSSSSNPPTRRPSARQARERLRQLGSLIEAQAALGWAVILVLIALLGVIYLNQTSRIATVGRQVQMLQFELSELRRDNRELERHIAEAQSLPHLQQEAARLGFSQAQPEDIEYIIVPNYLVSAEVDGLNVSLGETAVTPQPPATIVEALQLAFQQRLNNLMQGEARE
jgi:cell division protein FtsB